MCPPITEDPTQSAKIICTIPARYKTRPSYYHSFGMTENYFVFLEQTLFISVPKLASSTIRQIPVCECLEYDPNETSLFHVIRKNTGEVLPVKFAAGPLFGMHIVNSYEQDGQIVFDICCFPDDSLIKKFYLEYLRHGDQNGKRNFPRAEVRRYVLPINVDPVRTSTLLIRHTLSANWGVQETIAVPTVFFHGVRIVRVAHHWWSCFSFCRVYLVLTKPRIPHKESTNITNKSIWSPTLLMDFFYLLLNNLCLYFFGLQKTTPCGVNLVTLTNTHAKAVLHEDGVIFLTHETVSPIGK